MPNVKNNQSTDHLRRLDRLFEQYDKDKSGKLANQPDPELEQHVYNSSILSNNNPFNRIF